jgi:catechol 2,3-dioxygenase-like lactoylglutathione lyase family enzyme
MTLNFIRATTVMAVPDLAAGVAFFRDLLGFTVYLNGGGYAYLQREGVGVSLMDPSITGPVAPGNRRFGLYIDVEDIEAVWRELAPRLAALASGDVHGPADKPYGQRELCILAPDGNLVVYGQTIADAKD